MTAAIYARVSTEEQSVQQQLDRLRDAAPGATEYVDHAVSGRAAVRPAFEEMRSAARAGRLQTIYAYRLDRLGRSAAAILGFFREMEEAGVRVVILDPAIDTSTVVGRLTRTLLAAMAELEADLTRERTKEALDAIKRGTRATKSGRPIGRPRRVTPEIEARIVDLRARGLSWKTIAMRVQIPWGTCSKVGTRLRAEAARSQNPHGGFIKPRGGAGAVGPAETASSAKPQEGAEP